MPDLDTTKSSRELNDWIAQNVMQWTINESDRGKLWLDAEKVFMTLRGNWSPSQDIGDARAMEDELERKGLAEKYVRELDRIICDDIADDSPDWLIGWAVIHASPLQRVTAAIKALASPTPSDGGAK